MQRGNSGGDNSGGEVGDGAALEDESVAQVVELLSIAGNVTLATHSTAAQQILMDRSPSHVVLYDPEPKMVRAIELAQASRHSPMHVYAPPLYTPSLQVPSPPPFDVTVEGGSGSSH